MQPQENPSRVLQGLHGNSTKGLFLKNRYCLECMHVVFTYIIGIGQQQVTDTFPPTRTIAGIKVVRWSESWTLSRPCIHYPQMLLSNPVIELSEKTVALTNTWLSKPYTVRCNYLPTLRANARFRCFGTLVHLTIQGNVALINLSRNRIFAF